MVERKFVKGILEVYKDAWTKQDPDKIITIFTKDASYHEKLLEKPYIGHKQIKQYWQNKVVEEQSDIKFKLLNVYVDGNTAIAEWDASFFSKKENKKIHIIEIAVVEFRGSKIKSIREYWHSERI